MINSINDILDYEASGLINKLIRFIGRNNIKRCMRRYERSLECSGPIFREYYLKKRHPWWNAFQMYFEFYKQGKSIRNNLTEEIKLLAMSAKKISMLQKYMPDRIKQKYRKDLIDDENAYNYLFEIEIAWHFYVKGCIIEWYDDDSTSHSEFIVKTRNFDFNVECKRFNIDIARKIHRKDFYRLVEKLLPAIEERGYSGFVDINLIDKLHADESHLNNLTNQVINLITADNTLDGNYQIPLGSVYLKLHKSEDTIVNLNHRFIDLEERMRERLPQHAHAAIFAKSINNEPTDPVEMTLISEKSDNVLTAIKKRISKAARNQLDKSKPGMIVCFLEGVNKLDLANLSSNSALQIMTNYVLSKDEFNHIAAITYCSEAIVENIGNAETYFNPELMFRNPNCIFEEAKNYEYFHRIPDTN